MTSLHICRICLRTEAKGYRFVQYQLKYFYEEVTAQKVADNDDLPQWICYECATILHKFHKFKEKCYIGQKCLKEMLRKGSITYQAIYKLDKATKQLKSSLDRFILSDRVKTFTVREKNYENQIKSIDIDLESNCHVKSEYYGHNICNINTKFHNECTQEHKTDVNAKNSKISDKNHELSNENHKLSDEHHKSTEYINITCTPNSSNSDNQTFCGENIFENPTSPISILLEKDNVIISKQNKLKKTKTKNLEIPIILSEFGKYLSKESWKKINLSEEEALHEFRKKSEDTKYLEAAFKCSDCFKGFSKNDMLNRHVQTRHSEELGNHECRVCRTRFKWLCQLRKHLQQHYTKYECQLCQAFFNIDSSALLHEQYHSGVTRTCTHCGDTFRHVTTYYTHMRTHRSAHVCVTCGASFVSQNGLLLHQRRKHSDDNVDSPSSDDENPCDMHCTRCDIRFRSKRAYIEHLFHSDMHSEVIKEEENDDTKPPKKIMGKRLREKITKELGNRKTDLEISPVKVKRRRKKTKKWHIKPSTCYQCGEHFTTQAACLKHHVQAHPRSSFHAPSQRHICELCGASLAPGSVALHQNMHTREIVYKCEICGREFYSKISLQRHIRTHTGEKPFACPLCEKRFTQSNSMKLHYRTFHLKQPYPKRNRNKKYQPQPTDPDEAYEESDSVSQQEPPPEVPSDARPAPEVTDKHLVEENMGLGDENMHYLTLT